MTTVQIIDKVTGWIQTNVCDGLSFKVPPEDDRTAAGGKYEHQLVAPTAFSLFVPARDRMPPRCKAPIPSCCVQILKGHDTRTGRAVKLRISFSTWSPGHHGGDDLIPDGQGVYSRSVAQTFSINEDGWRDAWNFLDAALAKLQSADAVDGLRIVHEDGFDFGPFVDEQQSIPNLWPFWFTYLEFSVDGAITRNRDIDRYL